MVRFFSISTLLLALGVMLLGYPIWQQKRLEQVNNLYVPLNRTGLLIPAYWHIPSQLAAFHALVDLKKKYSDVPILVILNAQGNNLSEPDIRKGYQEVASMLRGANIGVLGYITSNYAATSVSQVLKTPQLAQNDSPLPVRNGDPYAGSRNNYLPSVASYMRADIPLDGFFVDEVCTEHTCDTQDAVRYYRELVNMIKLQPIRNPQFGAPLVIGNPGAAPSPGLSSLFDYYIPLEFDYTTNATRYTTLTFSEKQKTAMLVYGVKAWGIPIRELFTSWAKQVSLLYVAPSWQSAPSYIEAQLSQLSTIQ